MPLAPLFLKPRTRQRPFDCNGCPTRSLSVPVPGEGEGRPRRAAARQREGGGEVGPGSDSVENAIVRPTLQATLGRTHAKPRRREEAENRTAT